MKELLPDSFLNVPTRRTCSRVPLLIRLSLFSFGVFKTGEYMLNIGRVYMATRGLCKKKKKVWRDLRRRLQKTISSRPRPRSSLTQQSHIMTLARDIVHMILYTRKLCGAKEWVDRRSRQTRGSDDGSPFYIIIHPTWNAIVHPSGVSRRRNIIKA